MLWQHSDNADVGVSAPRCPHPGGAGAGCRCLFAFVEVFLNYLNWVEFEFSRRCVGVDAVKVCYW